MTPSTGEGVEQGQPQIAIAATSGAREELCSGGQKEGRELGLVEEGVWVLTKASNQAGNGRRKELDVGGGAAALAARRWPIPVGVGLGRARGCSEEMEGKARRSWSRGIRMGRHGWPARRSARQSA